MLAQEDVPQDLGTLLSAWRRRQLFLVVPG